MTQLVIGSKVQQMFGSIAKNYDCTNTVLSFGIHLLWRRRFFATLPRDPSLQVLDLCTGTGDLIPELSQRYANVIGIDFCLPMLVAGLGKWINNANAAVVQGDGLSLPIANSTFDLVTVAFGVRNFESLPKGLSEIHRVLKPGGRLYVLEFGQPRAGMWGAMFRFYSRYVMPIVGGFLTGNRAAYQYLPQTAKEFPCREAFLKQLADNGFGQCEYQSLSGGVAYIYGGQRQ